MNVTLGTGKAVHTANRYNRLAPACAGVREGQFFLTTSDDVTCKKCLKIVADREEATKRTAYYAGLADQQDETLSHSVVDHDEMDALHAEALAEDEALMDTIAPALTDEPWRVCCEHAAMYHGATGCDCCGCETPRSEIGRFDANNPPLTVHETDPRTSLPIVTAQGERFVVGLPQQDSDLTPPYVDFWYASDSVGNFVVHRAYADARPGTVARQVWDAQAALR